MRRGRRIGVDAGDVRIGVAVCDPDGLVATPYETVAAGPDSVARIVAIVEETGAFEAVVGLPRSMNGREGPAAVKVRAYAQGLRAALPVGVSLRLFDERMTTVTAGQMLRQGGRSSRASRQVIDQAAATVILQGALDAERTRGSAPGETLAGDQ